jgi:hypothetical protein
MAKNSFRIDPSCEEAPDKRVPGHGPMKRFTPNSLRPTTNSRNQAQLRKSCCEITTYLRHIGEKMTPYSRHSATRPGRPCKICSSADRKVLDKMVLAGTPVRVICQRFPNFSRDSVYRHSQKHLSRAQLRASIDRADDAEEQHEVALVLDARKLRYKAIQLLLAAERSGDLGNAIRAVREARDCLLAEARLSGQLDPPPAVSVNVEQNEPGVVIILPSNGHEPPGWEPPKLPPGVAPTVINGEAIDE